MNLLDFLLLLPVVWLCIRGFGKGLIIEIATLAGLALGILAAYYFADDLQALIKDYFTFNNTWTRIVAYIIIFVLVWLVVFIIGKIVEKSVDLVAMGWLNKLLGAIVGIAKGIVLVCIILFLIEKFDPSQKVIKPNVKEKSMFYQPAMKLVHFVAPG
jgi:membrane protein required for colicin V production